MKSAGLMDMLRRVGWNLRITNQPRPDWTKLMPQLLAEKNPARLAAGMKPMDPGMAVGKSLVYTRQGSGPTVVPHTTPGVTPEPNASKMWKGLAHHMDNPKPVFNFASVSPDATNAGRMPKVAADGSLGGLQTRSTTGTSFNPVQLMQQPTVPLDGSDHVDDEMLKACDKPFDPNEFVVPGVYSEPSNNGSSGLYIGGGPQGAT